MAVSDGHIKRLIVNIFPGAMKSLVLNVFWPAWEWGPLNRPHERYISTSYSAGLTERDNARLLRILMDPVYRRLWPHVVVTKEGVGCVETSKTGWKLATSVGGKMTGFRGSRILIDDPDNPKEVMSEEIRRNTTLWLREVMPDRLSSLEDGAIVLIQQRVHEMDSTGVLAKYGTGYQWLCIPMEYDPLRATPLVLRRDSDGEPEDVWVDPRGLDAEGNELLGLFTDKRGNLCVRPGSPMALAEGALAWPERFPPDEVEEMRRAKGAYAYQSQYQQIPSARGGEIVRRDWWQPWAADEYPALGTVIASVDTAQEENSEADYNACTVWGAFADENGAPQLLLLEAWRVRCKLAELVKRLAETCGRRKADYLLVEHKTRGRDVSDEILRLYATAAWQTVLVQPRGDKVARLSAVSHLFSGDMRRDPVSKLDVYDGGMIWAPDRDWADEVISEVTAFPRGAHDDYVDSVSMALGFVRRQGVVLRRVEHDEAEREAMLYRKPVGVPYAIESGR